MQIVMGPVLGFAGVTTEHGNAPRWSVTAVVVVRGADDPDVTLNDAPVAAPVVLLEHGDHRVLRYDLSVAQTDAPQRVIYKVAHDVHNFHVPAAGRPPRMAFASCNGFSDPKYMKNVDRNNERWAHMANLHDRNGYHLLLMGGDQVYADPIWNEKPFHDWAALDLGDRVARSFTKTMERRAADFFFNLYVSRWSQREVAHMLASAPTLMMWDDHDIFDGWGSYSDAENACPVFRGLFEMARQFFSVFQCHAAPGDAPAGSLPGQSAFTFAHTTGDVALLGLDLRSERTNTQVMSALTWKAIVAWMDAIDSGTVRHLLVMSSIPVVYPDFSAIERLIGIIPGRHELEDDLRDHWHSTPHKQERVRLIQRLLRFSREKAVRVSILSGDVHVAAVGVIQSDRDDASSYANVINQLTSSGVVHPPPPAIAVWAFENLVGTEDEPIRGVTTRLMELPGASRKLIAARNWLAIEPDEPDPVTQACRHRLWANWHIEGEVGHAYTKVIHATH